jgi:flagellar biogenesis protein FliO
MRFFVFNSCLLGCMWLAVCADHAPAQGLQTTNASNLSTTPSSENANTNRWDSKTSGNTTAGPSQFGTPSSGMSSSGATSRSQREPMRVAQNQQNQASGSVASPPESLATQSNTDQKPSLPLQRSSKDAPGRPNLPKSSWGQSLAALAGSLAVVLGVFFLLAWFWRRSIPQGVAALPSDVFEILGRAPLAGRQQVHLLRCGNKLLLVSVTPTGAETLTEITEAAEVERLTDLCRKHSSKGATETFRRVFDRVTAKHREPGASVGEDPLTRPLVDMDARERRNERESGGHG